MPKDMEFAIAAGIVVFGAVLITSVLLWFGSRHKGRGIDG